MNEEKLIEFINWLPTAVPEFQNASPEQIVQTLNQLYESEEGQATLSQLFTAFQESKNEPQSQMFKKGGKLDQLVNKAKKGKKMCCKKKEIVQGGMANKVAEKMHDGGKHPSTSKNTDSNTTYSRLYGMYESTPAGEGEADVATILRPISNDQHEAIDRIISGNDFHGIGDTLYRRRLLNGPYLVPDRSEPQYYLTPRDAAWQKGGYGNRKFEGLGAAPREWEALFKSFETPQMKNGDKMPSKSVNSILFPGMNYDYSNLTKPFDENGNIVDTTQSNNPNIFQRFKNWWQRNTQPTITTEPARSLEQIDSLLNPPRPSFFGSPRRKQTTPVLTAQEGGELENPLVRNKF